ncbi:MAG: hypothetical protein VYA54_06575 [Bdellovibrionota bacterium]|nr:hypothetical protein [Bdellovibrionota bacterium]
MRYFIILFLFIHNASAQIDSIFSLEAKNLSTSNNLKYRKTFGHNLSSNSYTLNSGDCVIGLYASGCGITNNLMVATSTWLFTSYNSYSLALKYAHSFNPDYRLATQLIYIKSFEDPYQSELDQYQMETIRGQVILSIFSSQLVANHINLGYEYFYDETFAHSLRRNPMNDQPYQLTFTNLTEFNIDHQYTIQAELGLLGINYFYPQIYTGMSFVFKFKNSSLQIGAAANGTLLSYFSSSKTDTQYTYADNKGTYLGDSSLKDLIKHDFAIHPEMQWQYFF